MDTARQLGSVCTLVMFGVLRAGDGISQSPAWEPDTKLTNKVPAASCVSSASLEALDSVWGNVTT